MKPQQRLYQLAGLFTAFQTASTPRTSISVLPLTKSISSSPRVMSVKIGQTAITRQLLSNVRDLWFNGLDEKTLCAPQSLVERWFKRSDDFDHICRSKGLEVLEEAKKSPVPTTTLLSSFPSPLDRLSLILLFDQLPRNIYRGPASSIAFTTFDPIAQSLTLQTLTQLFSNAPAQNPNEIPPSHHEALLLKCNMAYRMWLILPLMHSEDLRHHNLATEGFAAMLEYVRSLKPDVEDELGRKFSAEELEVALKSTGFSKGFSDQHRVIIERFGRYPHRNKVLGRESTREEVEYLENGGSTFGM